MGRNVYSSFSSHFIHNFIIYKFEIKVTRVEKKNLTMG
ncbi:hypothetical protein CHCC20335_1523 [Bacillus paralicheniformis]|nr:hypothetical protein CHCC20335_1523 [Bacillus paralicheniformis]